MEYDDTGVDRSRDELPPHDGSSAAATYSSEMTDVVTSIDDTRCDGVQKVKILRSRAAAIE